MSFRTGEVPCVIRLCKSSGAPYGGRRFLVLFLLQSGLKKIVRDALHAWIRAVGAPVLGGNANGTNPRQGGIARAKKMNENEAHQQPGNYRAGLVLVLAANAPAGVFHSHGRLTKQLRQRFAALDDGHRAVFLVGQH